MLNERRIKEAESNVKNYLKEGLLKKVDSPNQDIKSILIKNSRESLSVANKISSNSNLWTIVCSYYSMYYIANAVLYNLKYKVGDKISHKVTADSLIVLTRNKLKSSFIEEYEEIKEQALDIARIKADEILESFEFDRTKRGKIQYDTTEQVKKAKAQTSLERAKKFVFEMEKLLNS